MRRVIVWAWLSLRSYAAPAVWVWLRLRSYAAPALLHLQWVYAHFVVAWDEWHMARLDHREPTGEWDRRILRAARWRSVRDQQFHL